MSTISFLGACREVGRSSFIVTGRESTMLDCGVKFGEAEEHPLVTKRLLKTLDRVVISHAHLDHSGYAPALFEQGYSGPVYCTKPTRDIMQLLLADYLRIARESGSKTYSQKGVAKLLAAMKCLEYGDENSFKKTGIRLDHAGHILGSATILLRHDSGTLLYTGDLNVRETRLLEPAGSPPAADALLMESTYGAKGDVRPSTKDATQFFISSLKRTLDAGGKVIVPTFAVGRGQEVLFTVESHMISGALPQLPIFLDGMVKKALRIYRHNAVHLKREIQLRILTSDDDPFKSERYHFPERKDRSDVLEAGPCVILSTSGMLNGGPVLHYLEKLGGDPANTLMLVGYQAEGTLGRKLLEGAREFTLPNGHSVGLKLKVLQAQFSAHADHDELVQYARRVQGLRKVFCVHGEGGKADELAADVERACNRGKGSHAPRVEAIVPELGSTHEL
ncbi:MAG: MBL fold metallo-hydrolase RNA specificity domain-containing protein [Candidatus Micrarchaeota archaeon]